VSFPSVLSHGYGRVKLSPGHERQTRPGLFIAAATMQRELRRSGARLALASMVSPDFVFNLIDQLVNLAFLKYLRIVWRPA
jgi:hypothetical protein